MTLRAAVPLLLALSNCVPPPAPPKTVDRFSAWIASGCETEDECKDMIRQAKEHDALCEAEWACKATAADVKAANEAHMKFRARQKADADKKEAEKPYYGKSSADLEPSKKAYEPKPGKLGPPPVVPAPPGCTKHEDGTITCPSSELTEQEKTLLGCIEQYGDNPPPGCYMPPPVPKAKPAKPK